MSRRADGFWSDHNQDPGSVSELLQTHTQDTHVTCVSLSLLLLQSLILLGSHENTLEINHINVALLTRLSSDSFNALNI